MKRINVARDVEKNMLKIREIFGRDIRIYVVVQKQGVKFMGVEGLDARQPTPEELEDSAAFEVSTPEPEKKLNKDALLGIRRSQQRPEYFG